VSAFHVNVTRDETEGSRYEDAVYSRRQLGNRTCEVQFEAVWDSTEDIFGDFFDLENIEPQEGQDDGWEIENVKLWPDDDLAPGLYLEIPTATLTEITCSGDVTDRITVKGTLKNQGHFKWVNE